MRMTRVVFGGLVFLAAFLLFAVEPMAAKRLLPVLGGSSAVWVTCLVFFQAVLLLGYLYAHWMVRSGRVWIHVGLLALAVGLIAMVPIALGSLGIDVHWNAAGAAVHPVRTIFMALGLTIGAPFLLLSATSPMLQVWWVRAGGGAVPYRLFALSNAGSLLALGLYPLVIEPHMTLAAQAGWWVVGFVVYAVGCAWLGLRVRGKSESQRTQSKGESAEGFVGGASGAGVGEQTALIRRWMWFLLPMGAAMQLSAVTSHLSQDVAAIPMLWVLPLGVYLVTFILAFEAPGAYRRWMVGRAMAVMLASLAYALSKVDTTMPIGMAIGFYLVELFVACWFCHAEVFRLRPAGGRAEESTVFYLMVAAGGAAGTFVVAIASPLVFRSNYDLALSFFVTAALAGLVTWRDGWAQRVLWVTGSGLLLSLLVMLHVGFGRHALMRGRNFYGALRVTELQTDTAALEEKSAREAAASGDVGTGPVRTLMNGRIRHGTQMLGADRRHVPTSYYGEDSGVGVAMRYCCEGRTKSVGVVGLGVGTLAAYGRAGDRMRFYEINPLVEPIARNLFTYLKDTPAQTVVVEGDGRASLEREAAQGFDVLVVDAFSGDAIPLHLLTREAMEVYKRQLGQGGVVAFHVSNSYLDLGPEIALLADSVGMQARQVESWAVPADGAYRATWVLVSGDAGFFAKPGVEGVVTRIQSRPGLRVWTDDYSSLLAVMRWR